MNIGCLNPQLVLLTLWKRDLPIPRSWKGIVDTNRLGITTACLIGPKKVPFNPFSSRMVTISALHPDTTDVFQSQRPHKAYTLSSEVTNVKVSNQLYTLHFNFFSLKKICPGELRKCSSPILGLGLKLLIQKAQPFLSRLDWRQYPCCNSRIVITTWSHKQLLCMTKRHS